MDFKREEGGKKRNCVRGVSKYLYRDYLHTVGREGKVKWFLDQNVDSC